MRRSYLGLAVLIAVWTGCTNGSAEMPDEATLLADKLASAASSLAPFYGHQDDLMYGHSWNATLEADTLLLRSDIHDVCGEYPAVLGLDLGGLETGDAHNLDGNDFGIMRRAAILHHERGGIITLSWHLRNPLTGGDAWDVSSDQAVASVLPGGGRHEQFLQWLDRISEWIGSVKTEAGKAIPMIFRPWHEHNGSWFWWGKDLCSPSQYNELWKMTHDYLVEEKGLGCLLWTISPNYMDRDFPEWTERYPGDDYVDIIGFDCYASANRERYISQMRTGLESLMEFCAEHGKLLALTETGYEGIPDPEWWTGTLSPAIKGFPVCYVLTWRNASDKPGHYYGTFLGEPGADDFCKWVRQDNIQLLHYENL